MEYLDQDFQQDSGEGLEVTRTMRQDWHTISRWVNFLSIVGFVLIGISLIAIGSLPKALSMLAYMGGENPMLELMTSMGTGLIFIMLLLLGVQFGLYYLLFRFARQLRQAIQHTNQEAFEDAWLNYRNFLRITGILLIVVLSIYAVLLLFFVSMRW